MSIVTKTGDEGSTGLMFNRRIPKTHPRIEACGELDELNAALGIARAASSHDFIRTNLLSVQRELVSLMGEVGTLPADWERYKAEGYACLDSDAAQRLEGLVKEIEGQKISYAGWATPGENAAAAALDLARAICRRAERRVWALKEEGELPDSKPLVYLNRLSDLLWLLARWAEQRPAA